jgi:hypothetical protein
MSGSLTRLVLRARGQLPVAEPVLSSRFALAGPSPTPPELETETGWSEPIEPAPASFVPPPRSMPASQASTSAATEPVDPSSLQPRTEAAPPAVRSPRFIVERPARISPERVQPLPLAVPTGRAATAAPRVLPGAMELMAPTAHSLPKAFDALGEAPSVQPAPYRAASAASPFAPTATKMPGATRATATATPAHLAGQTVPARIPDVQISIGRLEVHGAPTRAAPVRAAPVRRPQLSLADYLARRK